MTEKFLVKAIHSYSKVKPDELELKEDDTIHVENDDDSSWWMGTSSRTNERGWFPSSFVAKIESKPKPKSKRRVRVIRRYEATEDDDLSLEVGDIVDVKREIDGWYLGRHNGDMGIFPVNYAEDYIEETPAARPLPQPPLPGRRGTFSSESSQPPAPPAQVPPSLPSRAPSLPSRASTDAAIGPAAGERMHAAMTSPISEEDGDDSKKEKKSGRRISRLFGSKKHKHKDGTQESIHNEDPTELAFDEPSADNDDAKSSASPAGTRPSTAKSAVSDDEEAEDEKEAAKPTAKLAKIIEDYEAKSPEELNLMKDDVVTIINRGTDDEPRWKGEYHGKKGYFPGTVVEPIEESAKLDEEGEEGGKPKGGFRLAAYGVQQGGLGSIFAGGGMPTLRKAAPRKNSEAEPAETSPAPAPAPVIPKLRSVPRPPKDTTPKEEEQQPNFLAGLNRIPRKQVPSASSEESNSMSPRPVAVPAVPISRRSTANNETEAEPEAESKSVSDSSVAEAAKSPELGNVPEVPKTEDAVVPQDTSARPQTASSKSGEDEEDAAAAATSEEQTEESKSQSPALDPVRSPSLPQVKRLVRRGPRQMPTAEGLKKSSSESQSQSLSTALRNDKDVEPEPAKPTPPPVSEKPKAASRYGAFSGPQLPTGGFKASGRIGSAMASRLAALQAQTSGSNADNESTANELPRNIPTRSTQNDIVSPPPPPVAKKPSFNPRAQSDTDTTAKPASAEWQRKIEDEQLQLRSEVDRARRSSEQVEQLSTRLAASERENQEHKQTISKLEQQVEKLVSQLAALQSDLSGIQRSVGELESNKGVSAGEVSNILRDQLQQALEPIHKHNQELKDGSAKLNKKIDDLRSYVDELVVEEEE
ncbi:hypothetical protein IWW36_004179 [Coemansia brasiliensis]|uniref:SH3 domain-containing protein n=1 Tax=Coemansia brasiliensis TaxID=2650707 RepID=A0A9W8LWI1_9FUNG|nr:hypothetical protein IWW36_004179 [Coemansia brasiliensis]